MICGRHLCVVVCHLCVVVCVLGVLCEVVGGVFEEIMLHNEGMMAASYMASYMLSAGMMMMS